MWYLLFAIWIVVVSTSVYANYPVFENVNELKELLIPADTHIGSIIYRLRATDSDRDYPLHFDATDYGSYVVTVENLPCLSNATFCEANVYLERLLMVNQLFRFRFTVRDTKGDTTTAAVSIKATDAAVDINIVFPHIPGIIILPEDTKPGTELEYVIVKKGQDTAKPPILEIYGASEVEFGRIRNSKETVTGVITLKTTLDFEIRNMYKLKIFALDIFTDATVDSRNIAGFELIMVVEDVQDTPPIFTHMQPVTELRSNLSVGDLVTSVTAVDGDRGNPRKIIYGLVSEDNPFIDFFAIDIKTGDITLLKPLRELTMIARSHQPILLTVLAEEERLNTKEPPALSATATLILLISEAANSAPYFDNDHYVCRLDENSPQGTALVFGDAYNTLVHDDDMGKQGVFSLSLETNNGTFEISPNVAERRAMFTIRVRNKNLLDYEARKSVHFVIVAREVGSGKGSNALSSNATVLVYLNDVNDNAPKFYHNVYTAQVPEDVSANTLITEVKATDLDTGLAAKVHYTAIVGFRNTSLSLNSITGAITVATDKHGFDREESSEYRMTVQARDMEGTGLLAVVPLIIRILDVNDETPVFQDTPIQFVLTPDLKNFSTKAFVKAIDKDAEEPNNIVRYEIVSGNYNNMFMLNAETGELLIRNGAANEATTGIRQRGKRDVNSQPNTFVLTIRAYDMGVPQRWATTQVHIYPPDSSTRTVTFVVPGKISKYKDAEELLTEVTNGGQVTILEINPLLTADAVHSSSSLSNFEKNDGPIKEKTIIVARVVYNNQRSRIVDLEQLYNRLHAIMTVQSEKLAKEQYEMKNAESPLVWLLIFLLLVLVLIITLLICYLWRCCPLYTMFYKNRKKSLVSDAAQTVNVFSKSVQVTRAGTGARQPLDSREVNNYHQHQQQQQFAPRYRNELLSSNGNNEAGTMFSTKQEAINERPIYIFAEKLSRLPVNSAKTNTVYMQDIADGEYKTLDPTQLNVTRRQSYTSSLIDSAQETAANNRSGAASDFVQSNQQRLDNGNAGRNEIFVKEGNAEILRLQTSKKELPEDELNSANRSTNDNSSPERVVLADTGGKRLIMEKFFRSQTPPVINDPARNRRDYFAMRSDTYEKNDESRNNYNSSEPEAYSAEKERRFVTSENRLETEETGTLNMSRTVQQQQQQQRQRRRQLNENDVADDDFADQSEEEPGTKKMNKSNEERMRAILTDNSAFNSLFGLSDDIDENSNKLTRFQRDILLTKFLVEEQKRLLGQVAIDTQSLPGNLTFSTGTQTDKDKATQTTDVLDSLRPDRRRVKSENDDSSDSDPETRRTFSRNRSSGNRRNVTNYYDRKHRIRTPILEENENVCENTVNLANANNYGNKGGTLFGRTEVGPRRAEESTRTESSDGSSAHTADDYYRAFKRRRLGNWKYISVPELADRRETAAVNDEPFTSSVRQRNAARRRTVSYEDINGSNYLLDSKEVYTPRALKSRLIARRRSLSEREPIAGHDSHSFLPLLRTSSGDHSSRYMNWYKTKRELRERKRLETETAERNKYKRTVRRTSSLMSLTNDMERKPDYDTSTYTDDNNGINGADSDERQRRTVLDHSGSCSLFSNATGSLKMKTKNQQLMEKKSVFTIAYDDAATRHIGSSSNGSNRE